MCVHTQVSVVYSVRVGLIGQSTRFKINEWSSYDLRLQEQRLLFKALSLEWAPQSTIVRITSGVPCTHQLVLVLSEFHSLLSKNRLHYIDTQMIYVIQS